MEGSRFRSRLGGNRHGGQRRLDQHTNAGPHPLHAAAVRHRRASGGLALAVADRNGARGRGRARRLGSQLGGGDLGAPRRPDLRRRLHRWLKRRTWLNIVVGGFAGAFARLAGAAAVDPRPSPEAALLGIALFFWTPPHFWSLALYHKADYAAARVPMLPVLLPDRATALVIAAHVLVVAAASIAAGLIGLGPPFIGAAIAGSAWFLVAAVRLALRPERGRSTLGSPSISGLTTLGCTTHSQGDADRVAPRRRPPAGSSSAGKTSRCGSGRP